MNTRFLTLFTLRVTHSYYGGEPCQDFDFIIAEHSRRVLQSARLLTRMQAGQLHVLFEAGEDNQPVQDIAGLELLVLHTPGHTPGGICLYIKDEKALFTGDTLFCDSVGRTDFPSGSMDKLIDGIKKKLLTLPDDTTCYPGHGPKTTIGREKKYNQYLQ